MYVIVAFFEWLPTIAAAMSDEQKAYRQALRDLPANTSDPSNLSWPNKP